MSDAHSRILDALLRSTRKAIHATARPRHVLRWNWGAEQSYGGGPAAMSAAETARA
ncbi:MAG: hypothetical protein HYT80_09635 [Euryarchaeota archaeon]|nr:hypothetical protein [Euryarchaeota archaeon]